MAQNITRTTRSLNSFDVEHHRTSFAWFPSSKERIAGWPRLFKCRRKRGAAARRHHSASRASKEPHFNCITFFYVNIVIGKKATEVSTVLSLLEPRSDCSAQEIRKSRCTHPPSQIRIALRNYNHRETDQPLGPCETLPTPYFHAAAAGMANSAVAAPRGRFPALHAAYTAKCAHSTFDTCCNRWASRAADSTCKVYRKVDSCCSP